MTDKIILLRSSTLQPHPPIPTILSLNVGSTEVVGPTVICVGGEEEEEEEQAETAPVYPVTDITQVETCLTCC